VNQPFAGVGLDPVAAIHAVRLLGREPDGGGAVLGRRRRRRGIALAARARILLRRRQHRAGLVVVERERPERLGRDVLGQHDLVGLRAVERFARGIEEGHQVLRSDAGDVHDHAGAVERVAVVEGRARIERARAGRRQRLELAVLERGRRGLEEGAALPEHAPPHRAVVVGPVGVRVVGAPVQRPAGRLADDGGVGEDPFIRSSGAKSWPLTMPMAASCPASSTS
jgi:hypothetical protein